MIPKFRAWLKKEKRMIDVSFLDFILEEVCEEVLLIKTYDFKSIELMQSTGLKDKNGKEIFEGDIVKYIIDDTKHLGYVSFSIQECGFVILGKKETRLGINNMGGLNDYQCHCIEVIGNIYENPKLLEESY